MNTILSIIPTDYPNQRNFKINGVTSDIVLYEANGYVYINSMSRDYLMEISKKLGLIDPEIINIIWRERQYLWLSGYMLETNYKSLSWWVKSIKALLKNNANLLKIVEKIQ